MPLRVLICHYAFLYALNPGARVLICHYAFLYAISPRGKLEKYHLHLITDILHLSLLSVFKTSKIPFGVSEYPFNVYNVSFVLMLFIFDERNDFLNISC